MKTREEIERNAIETMGRIAERDRTRHVGDDPACFLEGAAWYVVRSNINCEERAERGLKSRGFPVYSPKQTREIRFGRRVAAVKRLLFTRHFFVRIDAVRQGFYGVRNCHGVESVLGVSGLPSRVPDAVVDELASREGIGAFDFRERGVVGPRRGELVKVAGGIFDGWVAEVADEADDDRRVSLLINLFNSQRIVKFALDDLRTPTINVRD